jgi:tellurite resistance protein TerC
MDAPAGLMITGTEFAEALPIIASLVVIEGLLSIDNALAIAAMASHLPERNQARALRLGIAGAYVGRGVALAFAAWIVRHPWMKALGAFYLFYLMCAHLAGSPARAESSAPARRGLFLTVVQIEFLDLALSLDNVIAAVAVSPRFWVVCTGVFIGIFVLRFLAAFCIRLIARFPILAHTAFILVGFVGVILACEISTGVAVASWQKFTGITAIVAATVLYGNHGPIYLALRPIVTILRIPMRAFAATVDAAAFPFRKVAEWLITRIAQVAARWSR